MSSQTFSWVTKPRLVDYGKQNGTDSVWSARVSPVSSGAHVPEVPRSREKKHCKDPSHFAAGGGKLTSIEEGLE